jgi:hypothetical protein
MERTGLQTIHAKQKYLRKKRNKKIGAQNIYVQTAFI